MRRACPTSTPVQRAPTATARWEALGSTVVLRVTEPLWLPRASAILARELDAIDRACSRFRADSDLTRVNTHAGGRPVPVAPLLVEALQIALRAAELTDGDVDPTVGAALVLAETGMPADWGCRPKRGPIGETFAPLDPQIGQRRGRVSPGSGRNGDRLGRHSLPSDPDRPTALRLPHRPTRHDVLHRADSQRDHARPRGNRQSVGC